MRHVIIAPHPDDEWIGCGNTILKKNSDKEEIFVILVTGMEETQKRVNLSKKLAKKYNYKLYEFKSKEYEIDEVKLASFIRSKINSDDILYIPDYDSHPDHQVVSRVCQNEFSNKLIQYCVYNNSENLFIRNLNRFLQILKREVHPSFKKNKNYSLNNYKLKIKKEIIKKYGEIPRSSDRLMEIKKLDKKRNMIYNYYFYDLNRCIVHIFPKGNFPAKRANIIDYIINIIFSLNFYSLRRFWGYFHDRFIQKNECYIIKSKGSEISSGQIAYKTKDLNLNPWEAALISFNTKPEFRGRRMYPHMLSIMLQDLQRKGYKYAYIWTKQDNIASIKGIIKAGFKELK